MSLVFFLLCIDICFFISEYKSSPRFFCISVVEFFSVNLLKNLLSLSHLRNCFLKKGSIIFCSIKGASVEIIRNLVSFQNLFEPLRKWFFFLRVLEVPGRNSDHIVNHASSSPFPLPSSFLLLFPLFVCKSEFE